MPPQHKLLVRQYQLSWGDPGGLGLKRTAIMLLGLKDPSGWAAPILQALNKHTCLSVMVVGVSLLMLS